MIFNSLQFGFFFVAVVVLYFILPNRFRWMLLLIASYYFYMCWNAAYLLLIVASTTIDYFCGLRMGKVLERDKRKKYLILSIIVNLGLLFTFKYYNFFSESIADLFQTIGFNVSIPVLNVLLPVGISFYTFQTLSYTIDVYRGKLSPERHFGIFALYVSFFPQLVAGPIERASHLLPQFRKINNFNDERVVSGLRLMLWGLFKKIVVADRLAIYVDAVYGNAEFHSGLTLLLATYFFAFQIYCDFSGYSDIAIGAARIMGYDLMKNFNRPYFAKTIPEFWKRWHISLSSWFKDYLYIPLGGNRVPVPRMYLNLTIVFLISGLWHGANWTFLLWGLLHGIFIVSSRLTFKHRQALVEKLNFWPKFAIYSRMFFTFHLVLFSWILFRSDNLSQAKLIITKMFSFNIGAIFIPALDQFVYSIVAIILLISGDVLLEKFNFSSRFNKQTLFFRWVVYAFIILVMLLIGVFNGSQFIYFQF